MKRWRAQRVAEVGIGLLLLLLVRSLWEYRRLNGLYGREIALSKYEPFISGCLMAALCVTVAFLLYVWGKHKSSVIVSAAGLVALLIYKIVVIA